MTGDDVRIMFTTGAVLAASCYLFYLAGALLLWCLERAFPAVHRLHHRWKLALLVEDCDHWPVEVDVERRQAVAYGFPQPPPHCASWGDDFHPRCIRKRFESCTVCGARRVRDERRRTPREHDDWIDDGHLPVLPLKPRP